MVRSRTVLALCDPEPFTVATWMLKSLTTGSRTAPGPAPCTANSVVAINTPYQRWMTAVGKTFHYKAARKRRESKPRHSHPFGRENHHIVYAVALSGAVNRMPSISNPISLSGHARHTPVSRCNFAGPATRKLPKPSGAKTGSRLEAADLNVARTFPSTPCGTKGSTP